MPVRIPQNELVSLAFSGACSDCTPQRIIVNPSASFLQRLVEEFRVDRTLVATAEFCANSLAKIVSNQYLFSFFVILYCPVLDDEVVTSFLALPVVTALIWCILINKLALI